MMSGAREHQKTGSINASDFHGRRVPCVCQSRYDAGKFKRSGVPPICQALLVEKEVNARQWSRMYAVSPKNKQEMKIRRYAMYTYWASDIVCVFGIRVEPPPCVIKCIQKMFGRSTTGFLAGENPCTCISCVEYADEAVNKPNCSESSGASDMDVESSSGTDDTEHSEYSERTTPRKRKVMMTPLTPSPPVASKPNLKKFPKMTVISGAKAVENKKISELVGSSSTVRKKQRLEQQNYPVYLVDGPLTSGHFRPPPAKLGKIRELEKTGDTEYIVGDDTEYIVGRVLEKKSAKLGKIRESGKTGDTDNIVDGVLDKKFTQSALLDQNRPCMSKQPVVDHEGCAARRSSSEDSSATLQPESELSEEIRRADTSRIDPPILTEENRPEQIYTEMIETEKRPRTDSDLSEEIRAGDPGWVKEQMDHPTEQNMTEQLFTEMQDTEQQVYLNAADDFCLQEMRPLGTLEPLLRISVSGSVNILVDQVPMQLRFSEEVRAEPKFTALQEMQIGAGSGSGCVGPTVEFKNHAVQVKLDITGDLCKL